MTSTPEPVDTARFDLVPVATGSAAEASETAEVAADRPADPQPATPTLEELRLALAALDEVAPKGAVGEVQDALVEDEHVIAIRHASALPGYPDWSWTVLLSRGIEGGPTVLEVALLPSEGSLLAPAWVPWSERLADYLAAKEAAAAEGEDEELESDLEADLDDDFDDDFEDVDDELEPEELDSDESDDAVDDEDEDERSY